MLSKLPECKAVVTAGQLATDIASKQFGIDGPGVGDYKVFEMDGRQLRLYRMPSSSRAYPMKIERKAEYYSSVLGSGRV